MHKRYPEIEKKLKEYQKLVKKLDSVFADIQKLMDKGIKKSDRKYQNLEAEYQKLSLKADAFKKRDLALVIFNNLKEDKPDIKNIRDGKIYRWDDLFDNDFAKVEKDNKKCLILSGLFLEVGPYRLK